MKQRNGADVSNRVVEVRLGLRAMLFLLLTILSGSAEALTLSLSAQRSTRRPAVTDNAKAQTFNKKNQQGKATARPNILFIIGDDWGWPHTRQVKDVNT